jgi:ABC-2 type transport system ATP-binding protein
MTSTTTALSLDGLTKRYGSRVAVDGLTVDVPPGVVAGFIGPNGAGKTTTMAMLLGLVRPSAGSGLVLGQPLTRPDRYLHRVGALVEGPALWPALTGVQNLRVLAQLGGHDRRRIPAVLDLVGLADRRDDRFGEYSLGMKQRLGIAAALLGDPALLVLDEPTNGLDPAGMTEIRDLIARVAGERRTVLVSSHILSELEHVSDWLLIIDDGRLVYGGPADGFAATARREIVLEPADAAELLRLADVVARHGLEAGCQGHQLVVAVDGHEPRGLAASLNQAAAASGIVLAEVHVRTPTLESKYLDMVGKDLVEGVRR